MNETIQLGFISHRQFGVWYVVWWSSRSSWSWSWCVCGVACGCGCGWCGTLKNVCADSKTPPCVHSGPVWGLGEKLENRTFLVGQITRCSAPAILMETLEGTRFQMDRWSFATMPKYIERFARQPPPGSLLTLPFSSLLPHLLGPNMCVFTRNRSQDHCKNTRIPKQKQKRTQTQNRER